MTARPGRRRGPPGVLLAWACVLVVTVGLGVLGQTGSAPATIVAASVPAAPDPAPSASAVEGSPELVSVRPPVRPLATRPPIGEDGVMGGLVFGTAWSWLEPAERDR